MLDCMSQPYCAHRFRHLELPGKKLQAKVIGIHCMETCFLVAKVQLMNMYLLMTAVDQCEYPLLANK